MTRYGRFIAVPAVALALLVGRPSVAQTPPASAVAEAGSHFHRGVELYKDADFAGAVVEFKRAYDLAPNWRVLYDLGQAYYQLAHYAQALQAFDAYLAQGGTHIPAARKTAVEREREELASRVARVEITVNADGADIRVDDESAGTSPLKSSVLVSVGHRKITISKEGRAPIERFVDVAAGDLLKLSFDFPPDAPTSLPPPPAASTTKPTPNPPPDTPPEPPTRKPVPWVPWALTGAFAVTAATVGVVTLSAKSDLTASLGAYPGDPTAINRERTRAKTLAIVDDCLLGATVVSAGVALWLTLGRGEEGHASASIGLTPRGILLRGDF
jgi:hypothetical protein